MKRDDEKTGKPERQRPGAEHLRNRHRHREKPAIAAISARRICQLTPALFVSQT
ncbi:MAG: hypothetical protein WA373_13830 [Burkholderiales bacterium]